MPPELDAGHVYHLFPVRSGVRDRLQSHLRSAGIETLIHYPIPIPRQPAFAGQHPADCPIAARVCAEVFSLPLYPALDDAAVDSVASAVASGPRHAPRTARTPILMRLRHLVTFVLIAAAQFGIFEVGLRTWGSSEAAPGVSGPLR